MEIGFDKRIELLYGLQYCVEKDQPKILYPEEDFFSETNLDRLQGNADVRNIGSNKVLQKSGFQLEGTIRHGKMVSQYCDYNIWGMIREDIAANK